MQPEVSVVIPTHDRCDLLGRTVRGALAQTAANLEVVIVDDGSTDGTSAMLASLADDRVVVRRHERPQRVSAARNLGIEAARGEWVAFLDDDDLWAPDKLARQLRAAQAAGADWAYTGFVQVDTDLRALSAVPPPPPSTVRDGMLFRNMAPAGSSTILVRRSLLLQTGGFDVSLHKLEDWDLWIRLAHAAMPACDPAPLTAYVEHRGMASRQTGDYFRELDILSLRYAGLRGSRPIDRVAMYRWIGWAMLQSRNRRGALLAYARAVREGDVPSAARCCLAALSPALAERIAYRPRDAAVVQQAEAWLVAYRGEASVVAERLT